MKLPRIALGVLVGSILALAACATFNPAESEAYMAIVGSWNVASQPGGWDDVRYVFKDDGRLEIYYDKAVGAAPGYVGTVTSFVGGDVYAKCVSSTRDPRSVGKSMRMAVAKNDDGTLKIGWYRDTDHARTWYLGLVRE